MATQPKHRTHNAQARVSTDPFDDLLTLEDTLYTSAYELGAHHGARAGRVEGRIFGLEKGFEKFAALGALQGRAVVWGARLPPLRLPSQITASSMESKQPQGEKGESNGEWLPVKDRDAKGGNHNAVPTLHALPSSDRLKKHVSTLHGLTDPLTFSTLNTEDAVADYDDRFKRAGAKAKIIERILNETRSFPSPAEISTETSGAREGRPKGRGRKVGERKTDNDDSMEDFAGSRFVR